MTLKPEAENVTLKPEAENVTLKPETENVALKPETENVTLKLACRAFMPKMWSTPHNINRCPVRLFEAFVSKRLPDMCYPEAPFYLAVNYNHTIHGFWYKIQKMGIPRTGVIMEKKKKTSYSCLSGKKTNHSARKTMITGLVKNDIPETQIIQLSGHKNLHSLNFYKKKHPWNNRRTCPTF